MVTWTFIDVLAIVCTTCDASSDTVPVYRERGAATEVSFWRLSDAISKSVIFIFSIETVTEAIAEFVLEDWSDHIDYIWLEALGSWLHWMGVLFVFAVESVSLLSIGGGEKRMRRVASAVNKGESAVHDVGRWLEGMTSVDPDTIGDIADIAAGDVLSPIWSILLVKIADSVEELVMDATDAEAPVGKSKCLPSWLDSTHAIGAAAADTDV